MREYLKLYIDGQWVAPGDSKTAEIINPATEEVSGRIALGTAADVDKAVLAARKAFTLTSAPAISPPPSRSSRTSSSRNSMVRR